ncbi:MAG TPA: ATP-binding protein [Chloroflexi bacterium]|nr:ATP-binding protein [Chloroflexota bacterium]
MSQVLTENELSLQHLQAELSRIDILIRRQLRLWQLAGQDPADAFRGLHISDDEAAALTAFPLGGNWGQTVALPPDEAESFAHAEAEAEQQIQAVTQNAHQQNHLTRLQHLTHAFNLDRFELDTLLICLAPALDLRYERLYAYLQDDATRKRPGVNLVLSLLCATPADRLRKQLRFSDEAVLFKYQFLERDSEPGAFKPPLLRQALIPDPAIVDWLLGKYRPPADLGQAASLLWSQPQQDDQVLAADKLDDLERLLGANHAPLLAFYGADRVRQEAAALALAARMGCPLLKVDLAETSKAKAQLPPLRALRLALRDAHLTVAVPYLSGWDTLLDDGNLPPELFSELCAYPDLIIAAGEKLWLPGGIERERSVLPVEFSPPPYHRRQILWRRFLNDSLPDADAALASLAGQFILTGGQIRDAVASARDIAARRGDELQPRDLFAAARDHSSRRLSKLARKIVPRYTWGDIVLPVEQVEVLREIVAMVRGRPKVLEEWGVGKKLASSAAVALLFAGPPGTGKTMAAEVIANDLQLDLYKIDLASVVSKYIGETEKNLEKIFDEAQSSNAILFFDEADAIFGKRSEVKDARDRYANIEVSYLLQRMESYDGVTILATNLRANLDEAFTRRIQFIIDIPFPDEAYRLQIWETLFPSSVPHAPDLDLPLMAQQFKLAGGNIRNIIVAAAYLAANDGDVVTMDHLFHSARRELQKMGRLVGKIPGARPNSRK